MEEHETANIIKILIAARELSLQELIHRIQSFLINNKVNWMEQNFNLVYQTSFENDSFLLLQEFCKEFIIKKPEKIFKSPEFNSISEKLLISIIQVDNFQMNGVQIWEHILKWGIAQNSKLTSSLRNINDPTSFTKDDFNILKNILRQCISFF